MRNSQKNGQGFDLSDMLKGTLQEAMQQGLGQGLQQGIQRSGAQGGGLLGALGSLAGLTGMSGGNARGMGGLGDLLNPQRARSRATGASAMPAAGLGGLLGALFGGGTRRAAGNDAMMARGLMAAGALGLQFLQKWMRQSQAEQQPRQTPQGQGVRVPEPYAAPAPQQTGYTQEMTQAGWGQAWSQPAGQCAASTTSTPQWDDPAAPAAAAASAQVDPAVMLLLEAMVNAAKADGNMDDDERRNIHNALAAFMPAEDIDASIAPLLQGAADPKALAARVQDIEQAKDVYRLSCAAIEVDSYMERAYLDALGDAMYLPPEVRAQLEAEARALQDSIQTV